MGPWTEKREWVMSNGNENDFVLALWLPSFSVTSICLGAVYQASCDGSRIQISDALVLQRDTRWGFQTNKWFFPKHISSSLVEDLTVLVNGGILCHPTPLKPSAHPSNGPIHSAAAGFLRSCLWAPRMQTRAQSWLLTPSELWGRTRRHLLGEGPQRHHRREDWMPPRDSRPNAKSWCNLCPHSLSDFTGSLAVEAADDPATKTILLSQHFLSKRNEKPKLTTLAHSL